MYDCPWGMDVVRVIVAGELPREAHNAPLHLFSASPELVGFGGNAYQRRSPGTSTLLERLFVRLDEEGFAMSFTMEDFKREYFKEESPKLTPEEQRAVLERLSPERLREVLQSLPPEKRLAGLSQEQIRQYLDQLTGNRPAGPRKPRRKK